MFLWRVLLVVIVLAGLFEKSVIAEDVDDYYPIVSIFTPESRTESRSKNWKPAPDGLPLEVSGMTQLPDGRLAVAIRKGEIWILDGVSDVPPDNVTYHKFASGLHEPLGLLWHDDSFYTVQRSELTRVRDRDGDGIADDYETAATGWGLTGHYHEYAYGPELDGQGNIWLTLNIGLGLKGDQLSRTIQDPTLGYRQARWRGWGMQVDLDNRKLIPICAGMRSPSGIGSNADGDMFYTDQQGNWVATNSLHHMRKGAFFHHPEALASMSEPDSPIHGIESVPNGVPFPTALKNFSQMVPPAVWFPYKKVGQSVTDIVLDSSGGKFGPFSGQLFVGEFTLASIHRVFLEKVDGEYQGACFPFRDGMASAVLRLQQASDGSLFAGLSNRGWSSLGTASYGLQRVMWSGRVPFEIQEMSALNDGFRLTFTKEVDPETAADVSSYAMNSYTYLYQASYGSEEIQNRELTITSADVSEDRLSVKLTVKGMRELFVHELTARGVRSADGAPLLHPDAYYTLNRIPKAITRDQ
ncbi:hypothetical protein KOR42_42740 [Thalassoglobus neptunius]|uniref:DUF7133 domain-containing protein n=1 Tax=Thalassoglobus neptunius TaxID=1938619 RepID=A0A5C5W7Y7_9PLAN|nr:hypothetical protein [Thalassoglobus neptunius]TWT47006.1 hypothetical protein KOR42_42740 [Thalassoglobus neptunius]